MGQPQDVRPLSGIRVLELTSGIAGPAAGRHLSAMGAEVIRLDSLKRPDALRLTGSGWLTTNTRGCASTPGRCSASSWPVRGRWPWTPKPSAAATSS